MEHIANSLNHPRRHFIPGASPLTKSSFPPTTPRCESSESLLDFRMVNSPSISQICNMRYLLPSTEDSATQRVAAIDHEVEEEILQSAARNNKRLSINNDDNLNTYTPTKCHSPQLNSLAHTDDNKEIKATAATKNLDEAKCKKIKNLKVCCDSHKFLPKI